MITVTMTRQFTFENEKAFWDYVLGPQVEEISGFGEEIKQAFFTGKSIRFPTKRPDTGVVTRSDVTVRTESVLVPPRPTV